MYKHLTESEQNQQTNEQQELQLDSFALFLLSDKNNVLNQGYDEVLSDYSTGDEQLQPEESASESIRKALEASLTDLWGTFTKNIQNASTTDSEADIRNTIEEGLNKLWQSCISYNTIENSSNEIRNVINDSLENLWNSIYKKELMTVDSVVDDFSNTINNIFSNLTSAK